MKTTMTPRTRRLALAAVAAFALCAPVTRGVNAVE